METFGDLSVRASEQVELHHHRTQILWQLRDRAEQFTAFSGGLLIGGDRREFDEWLALVDELGSARPVTQTPVEHVAQGTQHVAALVGADQTRTGQDLGERVLNEVLCILTRSAQLTRRVSQGVLMPSDQFRVEQSPIAVRPIRD
jgi:hypothetical protein